MNPNTPGLRDGGNRSGGRRKGSSVMPRRAAPEGAALGSMGGDVTVPVYLDGRKIAESTARHSETKKARR